MNFCGILFPLEFNFTNFRLCFFTNIPNSFQQELCQSNFLLEEKEDEGNFTFVPSVKNHLLTYMYTSDRVITSHSLYHSLSARFQLFTLKIKCINGQNVPILNHIHLILSSNLFHFWQHLYQKYVFIANRNCI